MARESTGTKSATTAMQLVLTDAAVVPSTLDIAAQEDPSPPLIPAFLYAVILSESVVKLVTTGIETAVMGAVVIVQLKTDLLELGDRPQLLTHEAQLEEIA